MSAPLRDVVSAAFVVLRRSSRSLLPADLFYQLAAFALLTPLVSLAIRLLVSLSGSAFLADQDILAFVLSLCSTSDAFIAATLDKFTYGAKLAFMVFGPMLDVKLIFLYQTVLKRRFILWLAIGLFLGIGAAAIAWQAVLFSLANP